MESNLSNGAITEKDLVKLAFYFAHKLYRYYSYPKWTTVDDLASEFVIKGIKALRTYCPDGGRSFAGYMGLVCRRHMRVVRNKHFEVPIENDDYTLKLPIDTSYNLSQLSKSATIPSSEFTLSKLEPFLEPVELEILRLRFFEDLEWTEVDKKLGWNHCRTTTPRRYSRIVEKLRTIGYDNIITGGVKVLSVQSDRVSEIVDFVRKLPSGHVFKTSQIRCQSSTRHRHIETLVACGLVERVSYGELKRC